MTVPRDPRAMRAQASEMETRLAAARHNGRSADRAVQATVTGQGKLIDLQIEDSALDGAHIQNLGPGILQAVRAARGAAHEASVPELSALFGLRPPPPRGPSQVWSPSETEDVRPEQVVAPPPRRRPEADDAGHEESFEEMDFLSDEETDERW
ncbi:ABC transporter substrate-binding protein [Amycolatopsis sp. WAC 04182]|uniref:YbaB/EbfC family nucleoid-associated protein n=1 Tax=Amycolatopsis sp. WAC 04182 TaxID=2203198 RepID=UPI000F79AE87|nr:YbaB/EbfC family nucleoid-associated protein [Amycolatopsis sp. WAC 04182]RSN57296.1 ABC transporter substrate-binding protein [Amycolatopsis sp. WAC 04182]